MSLQKNQPDEIAAFIGGNLFKLYLKFTAHQAFVKHLTPLYTLTGFKIFFLQ